MRPAQARAELDRFLGIEPDDLAYADLNVGEKAAITHRENSRFVWTGPTCPPRADWFDNAACQRIETRHFFAFGDEQQRALAVCADCPVWRQCRDYGREHHMQGIWGGETELDRARLGHGDATLTGDAYKALLAQRRAQS